MSFNIKSDQEQTRENLVKGFSQGLTPLELEKGRKAHPVGYINNYREKKMADGTWKYVGKGKKSISEGSGESSLKSESEGSFTNKEGEKLTFRVYKDGAVKIEGANMRKDFSTKAEAEKYIAANKKNPITGDKVNREKKTSSGKTVSQKPITDTQKAIPVGTSVRATIKGKDPKNGKVVGYGTGKFYIDFGDGQPMPYDTMNVSRSSIQKARETLGLN